MTTPTTLLTTQTAYDKVHLLDVEFIGTPDYMGLAYFWNHKYRHSLRDASAMVRCRVHAEFLKYGLAPDGDSKAHNGIVNKIVPNAV